MRNFIVYISMGVFLYLYSYFLGGDNTMLMLYMLVFALFISVILTIPLKGSIVVSIDAPTIEVEKDGVVKVKLHIHNRSILPVPFIDVSFIQSQNFAIASPSDIRFSLGSRMKKTISVEYCAKTRGVSRIGVESVYIKDYLGFFRINLTKNIDLSKMWGEVTVIPRLYSINLNSKIMQNTLLALMPEDNNVTTNNMVFTSGEPGYEFREYVGGDPLHKIHWKLSAKKDILMVRKDEGRGIPKKCLIVDPCLIKPVEGEKGNFITRLFNRPKDEKNEDIIFIEEKILEAMIAVAHGTVSTNSESDIWLYEEGQWRLYSIREKKDIGEMQNRLAAYDFVDKNDLKGDLRLPVRGLMEQKRNSRNFSGGEVIVFTGFVDDKLMESVGQLNFNKYYVNLVSVKNMGDAENLRVKIDQTDQGTVYEVPMSMDLSEAF
jgi:hypothetical protein